MEGSSNYLKKDHDDLLPQLIPRKFPSKENGLFMDKVSRSLETGRNWLLNEEEEEEIEDETKTKLLFETKLRKDLESKLQRKEQQLQNAIKENKELKDRLGILSDDYQPSPLIEPRKTETIQNNHINDDSGTLKQELADKNVQLKQLNEQLKESSLITWRTMNDKLKQDVEMEVLKRKYKLLQEEQAVQLQILGQRDEEIRHLKREIQEKNEANYKMAVKLLDLKSRVDTVDLQLRKYTVKKIYKIMSWSSVDVDIVLSKNPGNGAFNVDVVEKGKHQTRPFKSIAAQKESENRFIITFGDGSYDYFESSLAKEIITTFTELTAV